MNSSQIFIYWLGSVCESVPPRGAQPVLAAPCRTVPALAEKAGLETHAAASSHQSASGTPRVGDNCLDKDSSLVVTLGSTGEVAQAETNVTSEPECK